MKIDDLTAVYISGLVAVTLELTSEIAPQNIFAHHHSSCLLINHLNCTIQWYLVQPSTLCNSKYFHYPKKGKIHTIKHFMPFFSHASSTFLEVLSFPTHVEIQISLCWNRKLRKKKKWGRSLDHSQVDLMPWSPELDFFWKTCKWAVGSDLITFSLFVIHGNNFTSMDIVL